MNLADRWRVHTALYLYCTYALCCSHIISCTKSAPSQHTLPDNPSAQDSSALSIPMQTADVSHTSGSTTIQSARVNKPHERAVQDSSCTSIKAQPNSSRWLHHIVVDDCRSAERWLERADCNNTPEMRYLRARCAIETHNYSMAATLLDGLEVDLPLLRRDIAQYRAISHRHGSQPSVQAAAQHFASQTDALSLMQASEAWLEANQPEQAKRSIYRAVEVSRDSSRMQQMQIRLLRARVALVTNDCKLAAADLFWVMSRNRSQTFEKQVQQVQQRLSAACANDLFSTKQHVELAAHYANQGRPTQTNYHLEQAAKGPTEQKAKGISPLERVMTQAQAYYNSRQNYAKAAQLYKQASLIAGPRRAEALYYYANATSRDNNNEKAIQIYRQLLRAYPTSVWGQRAWFYGARLERFQLRYSNAAKQFSAYLKRHPKGILAQQAREQLAICYLLAGRDKQALSELENLEKTASKKATKGLTSTYYRYLIAFCSLNLGNTQRAVNIWRNIIQTHPLSFFALAATARLMSIGQSASPMIPSNTDCSVSTQLTVAPKLPPTVQMLNYLGLSKDAERYLIAEEKQIIAHFGPQAPQALCHMYEQLHVATRQHIIGQKHVPVRLVQEPICPSTRWAWQCLYPRPYAGFIEKMEQQNGLPAHLLYALIRQESAFNPDAVSSVGAQGLVQLMPVTAQKTAARMGLDYTDSSIRAVSTNIRIGAHYLSMLFTMMKSSPTLSIAAYNAGPQAVKHWIQRSGKLSTDIWTAVIPYQETREYVWRVIGNWARYHYLATGNADGVQLDLALPSGIQIPEDAY